MIELSDDRAIQVSSNTGKPVINGSYAAVDKAGLPGTKFSSAVTAKFNKIVYDAAWAAVKKKAPNEGAKLEKLLMK